MLQSVNHRFRKAMGETGRWCLVLLRCQHLLQLVLLVMVSIHNYLR